MPDMDFSLLSIPQGIKDALKGLIEKFDIKKFDPKGGAGHTFFCRNRVLSTDVAIKFYYWGGDPKFHAEPQALTEIQSPNVLAIHDAGYAGGDYAYFVVLVQFELASTRCSAVLNFITMPTPHSRRRAYFYL
jgi:hypothetical protein